MDGGKVVLYGNDTWKRRCGGRDWRMQNVDDDDVSSVMAHANETAKIGLQLQTEQSVPTPLVVADVARAGIFACVRLKFSEKISNSTIFLVVMDG